jgi:hypothetical protein
MRPSELLGAKSLGNTVTLFPIKTGVRMYFGGANVQTNAVPKNLGKLSSLTAVIEKDKKGILAICISYDHGKSTDEVSFFLQVKNENGTAEVDLVDPWYPDADRLGQVHAYGYVTALIDGKWYCSEETSAKQMKALYIPDGNLLCQYIAKDVSAHDFNERKEMTDVLIGDGLLENAGLRERVKWLERDAEMHLEVIQKREEKIFDLKHKLEEKNEEIKRLNSDISRHASESTRWQSVAEHFKLFVDAPWWERATDHIKGYKKMAYELYANLTKK